MFADKPVKVKHVSGEAGSEGGGRAKQGVLALPLSS